MYDRSLVSAEANLAMEHRCFEDQTQNQPVCAVLEFDQVAVLQLLVNPAGLPGDGFIREHL